MSSNGSIVQSFQLRGHQGAVLCLDHSSSITSQTATASAKRSQQEQNDDGHSGSPVTSAASLLSGGEDRTCRVWDLRASCRASLCIKCPGEVLSVAFGPVTETPSSSSAESHESVSPFSREYSVYTAVDNSVYGYDLRKASSPIVTEPTCDLSFLNSTDEINQVAFSPTLLQQKHRKASAKHRNNKLATLLATADDSGYVRVTENFTESKTDGAQHRRKQEFCHGDDAMVTSLAFAPRIPGKKQTVVASGGTDCRICLWDVAKEQKYPAPLHSVLINPTSVSANQLCNPPMVHALSWSPSGRWLMAGLGDGSLALFNNTLVLSARLDEAHGGAIAACLFPQWTHQHADNNSNNVSVTAQDRLVCTAGNDGLIALWDLGPTLCGDKAVDPKEQLRLHESSSVDEAVQRLVLNDSSQLSNNGGDALITEPVTLFGIQHGAKPNWMVSSRGQDPLFPSSLFVADTTNNISVYTVPLV